MILLTEEKFHSINPIKMADPAYPLRITNVVGNAAANYQFHIIETTEDFQGRYAPDVFPACVSICKESSTTHSIFLSGQIGISGGKSAYQCLSGVLETVMKMRRDFRIPMTYYNFHVNNIVAACKLGYQINRDLFYAIHKQWCNWDPESFTGLSWRTLNPKITFVIFENGAVIAAGLPNPAILPLLAERLRMLKPFELGKEYTTLSDEQRRTRYTIEDVNEVDLKKQFQWKQKNKALRSNQAENWSKYLELQAQQNRYYQERQEKGEEEDGFDKEHKRIARKRKTYNPDATDVETIELNKQLILKNPGFYSKQSESIITPPITKKPKLTTKRILGPVSSRFAVT